MYRYGEREREREREGEREIERATTTKLYRQRSSTIHRCVRMNIYQTKSRCKNRQEDKQTNRQTDRQIDRHAHSLSDQTQK